MQRTRRIDIRRSLVAKPASSRGSAPFWPRGDLLGLGLWWIGPRMKDSGSEVQTLRMDLVGCPDGCFP
ncbi:hypothetical protein LZ190_26845, partial [Rhodovulum sulfidophilum]|nr:hypothetical protein [Rhodovulum sulfidophilum]